MCPLSYCHVHYLGLEILDLLNDDDDVDDDCGEESLSTLYGRNIFVCCIIFNK